MNALSKEAPERQEIEALLPWHAAGTLNRRDADRVEQALASDRELARHFELVREELGETIHLNESLGAPSARAMEKLFASIDAEAPVARNASFNLTGRIVEFFSNLAPRTVAWAAAGAAALILVQAAVLTTVVVQDQAGPTLASYSDASGSPELFVRFAPQANIADITRFLDVHKVEMVGGPNKRNFYTVRLTTPDLPKTELTRIVQKMQSESKIVEFIATKD